MDRNKLIERARKLLAMSGDAGSPTEAAIADRRLKVLMDQHDISIAEIKRTEQSHPPHPRQDEQQRPPARRKRPRTQPFVRWKQPRSTVRLNLIIAVVALSGFIATLGFWITYIGDGTSGSPAPVISQTRQLEDPPGDVTRSLTARVDRTSVFEGETIVLFIKGSGIAARPNTSSLWQDFKVIETMVSEDPDTQDYRIRILLQPRRTGTLIIPSFYANEVRSELINMNVLGRN